MLLVKFDDNWADEFDLEGCIVISEENWQNYKAMVETIFKKKDSVELYFGTNESNTYSSAEDYFRCFEEKTISDDEANLLIRLLDLRHAYSLPTAHKFGKVLLIDTSADTNDDNE